VPEPGEVYHDDVFDWETIVVDVKEDVIILDDPVGGEGTREYSKEIWKLNESVGRFDKLREVDPGFEEETDQNENERSIFDF
jgi:hypothetical protein